jgi:large subunit ribosomal protein L4
MKAKIYDLDKPDQEKEYDLQSTIFGKEVRIDIIKRVIDWQLLKRMSGTHKAKTVSDISGTTKKPHKQKGTGMARQGSLRSVQMRGGAVSHGPVLRSHAVKLQKKVRNLGLCCALSAKFNENRLILVEDLNIKSSKTKDLKNIFDSKIFLGKSYFIIDGQNLNENFIKASSNLVNISAVPAVGMNVYDIVKHEYVVITRSGLENIELRLSNA